MRLEVRALRFDMLHLLRSRLLHLGPCITLHVLLVGCRSRRSCTGFSRGLLHTLTLLALLNLLPLLPLDGGHIVFALLEGARGRNVRREVYERVSAIGIAVVLLLFFICVSNTP